MKHGKNPTKSQRTFIQAKGLNPQNWLVVKDTPERMELVHRHFESNRKIIPKGVRYDG